MRSTITLNGQESTEIEGLIIQSLPPISKPLMRTQIEEIDGRDGDIVTNLGFSAYTKEISIGLYGDFDIDEVISYFNSQGTVTFSNEPDKYYYYQIINQIDFERLIRFRTATVSFHVQPFKYSTDENPKTYNANLLNIPSWSQTKNGVTVRVNKGAVSVSGTASTATEFYVPITAVNLSPASYTLTASTTGTNAGNVAIRLIYDSPSNANSFGGQYQYLSTASDVTIEDTLSASKSYNYLWVYATTGAAIDIISAFTLQNDDDTTTSLNITNSGNYFSRPTLTLTGSGTINLSLNNNQIFVINLGDTLSTITIDTNAMEAYSGTPETLMNRSVNGDYNNFMLNVGSNTISWSGNLTKIVINNYSRWI